MDLCIFENWVKLHYVSASQIHYYNMFVSYKEETSLEFFFLNIIILCLIDRYKIIKFQFLAAI